ncbi:glycosyltransferase [Metabacillus indicus]|uniref:Glycosyltransferase 2-like domain-containing protein n=2 Tax=Metabacillus indicus TaxID=246786 RepID=A0A084H2W5_METID|nr:glycosyltransferase family 2 protein [Metabacillus sp. cB07]KEZ53927.1 hypothetical protein GS18_0203025 [Metabacillus indicus]
MLLLFEIFLACLLAWTILNSLFMPSLKKGSTGAAPLVSILIPLRNEEKNAEDLAASLKNLSYPNLEIIMLDDQSTDRTKEILTNAARNDSRFKIVTGSDLPDGWAGKVFACHQLSSMASGDYYLFLDADVRVHKHTIERSLALMKQKKANMLSGFPRFPVKTILEKWLVPMQHLLIYFHLPLYLANYTPMAAASAAHGAFIMFEKNAYRKFGGHKAVKDAIVDDVALAKITKQNGYRAVLANVTEYVTCYMYDSNKAVWEGFKKNIFPGFGRSILIVILFSLFYGLVYLFPFFLALYGITELIQGKMNLHFFVPYLLIVLQKAYIDLRSRQTLALSPAIPFSAAAFLLLLYASMFASVKKTGYTWKGRTYD